MDKKKYYTGMTVKAIDEDQRIFRGMATTPQVDRDDDIVNPLGATFPDTVPLLLRHDHSLPVGTVKFGKPTKDGIPFEAHIPVVPEPAGLRARVDEAWQSVKTGIMRAVSIGFRGLEYEFMDNGGILFKKLEIYELSLVAVPANAGATITEIKAYCEGNVDIDKEPERKALKTSVSAEKQKTIVKLTPQKENNMSIQKNIDAFKAELAAKSAKLVEMTEKSADQTFDEVQAEEFNTLKGEIKQLKDQIEFNETALEIQKSLAKPVTEEHGMTQKGASAARTGVAIKQTEKTEPGVGLARLARVKYIAHRNHLNPMEVAANMYASDDRIVNAVKAAVAPGTTTGATWAAPLVNDGGLYADFAEFLRPETILGKFGRDGVPSLRNVPFRVPLVSQTTGGDAYWTGEAAPKGVTNFDFAKTELLPYKIANIAVLSMELLEDSSPSSDLLVRTGLRDALVSRLDRSFIDPAVTLSSGVRPASITNGVTAIPSRGSDADAVRCDIKALMATFLAANNIPSTGVIIMPTTTAMALSLMQKPLGDSEFPGIGLRGGNLLGFPVIVSDYVPVGTVVLMNASDIYYNDGEIRLDVSNEASIQMDTEPDNPVTASTVTVNMFQHNLFAFRVEKRVGYMRRRTGSVAVLSGVAWGDCES